MRLQVIVGVRMHASNHTVPGQLLFAPLHVATSWSELVLPPYYQHANQVLFAPCSPEPEDAVWGVAKHVESTFGVVAVCLPCDTGCGNSMAEYFKRYQRAVLAGVVFLGNASLLLQPGTGVEYRIRLDGDVLLPSINATSWTPSVGIAPDLSALSYAKGFSPVQLAVEHGVLSLRNNGSLPLAAFCDMFIQEFPLLSYQETTAIARVRTCVAVLCPVIYVSFVT